jgi:hypothetical protein
MGLVICPKHGNGFLFVCPHVVAAVESGSSCPGLEYRSYTDPELEGIELGCWFCPECIAEHRLPPTGTAIPNPEGFLNRTSALYRPMCPGCFEEWQNS